MRNTVCDGAKWIVCHNLNVEQGLGGGGQPRGNIDLLSVYWALSLTGDNGPHNLSNTYWPHLHVIYITVVEQRICLTRSIIDTPRGEEIDHFSCCSQMWMEVFPITMQLLYNLWMWTSWASVVLYTDVILISSFQWVGNEKFESRRRGDWSWTWPTRVWSQTQFLKMKVQEYAQRFHFRDLLDRLVL